LLTERHCLLDRQTAWILHHLPFREWRKTIFSGSDCGSENKNDVGPTNVVGELT